MNDSGVSTAFIANGNDNPIEAELDEDLREAVEKSARHLYDLIHARLIITGRGVSNMAGYERRAEEGVFGGMDNIGSGSSNSSS